MQEALTEIASQNRMLNTRLQGLDQQLKLKKGLYDISYISCCNPSFVVYIP